ncbi:MAG: hypothetical protein JNM17_37920 [Archangium sp.]|nr:hypothetical protein [Archangium sp.]
MSDPTSERDRLRLEVETLKARRELVHRTTIDESLLRAATTTTGTVSASILSVGLAFVGWLMVHDAFLEGRDATVARLVQFGFLGAATALFAWRFSGPWRLRRELSTLPFPVIGLLETLSEAELSGEVTIDLVFADTQARFEDFAELLRSKVPEVEGLAEPRLARHERGFSIAARVSTPARFALATWFRLLGRHVLRDLHKGWPLARVEVVSGSRRRDLE